MDESHRLVQERKFIAHFLKHKYAFSFLKQVCISDPQYFFGIVHSIYFDTPQLTAYYDKINGNYFKAKLRLRWYQTDANDKSDSIHLFLETKIKQGHGREKARKKITLLKKDFENLLHDPSRLTYYISKQNDEPTVYLNNTQLIPTIHITYERHRFICPFTSARVSLDNTIQASGIYSHLFPYLNYIQLDNTVLEIKQDTTLEQSWLHELYSEGFKYHNFSKYATCISQIATL